MKIFCLYVAVIISNLVSPLTPASATDVAPMILDPGSTISPLPNGFSSSDGIPHTILYDQSVDFSFSDGLAGILRDRVIQYSDAPSVIHPGLYFDYEVQLDSGSLAGIAISGYATFDTSVKVCGITGCGGSGADGMAPTSASRSVDGNDISFDFGDTLTAGEYSANLQIFSSASLFEDPLALLTDSEGNAFSIDVVGPLATDVPEPPTWAMMVAGFGVVSLLSRRRSTTNVRSA